MACTTGMLAWRRCPWLTSPRAHHLHPTLQLGALRPIELSTKSRIHREPRHPPSAARVSRSSRRLTQSALRHWKKPARTEPRSPFTAHKADDGGLSSLTKGAAVEDLLKTSLWTVVDQLAGSSASFPLVLTQTLFESFQKYLRTEVLPLLELPPKRLTTVDPYELRDTDSNFVSVGGVRIHYKDISPSSVGGMARAATGRGQTRGVNLMADTGVEEPPVVVMLHGYLGSEFCFRSIAPDLARAGVRAIAFDRPPYGLSDRPLPPDGQQQWDPEENPYSSPGGVRLTLGLLDELGINKAVIMGHSLGGAVAAEFALKHPERVQALILVSPAIFSRSTPFQGMSMSSLFRLASSNMLLQLPGINQNYVRRLLAARSSLVEDGNDPGEWNAEESSVYLRPLQTHNWDLGFLYHVTAYDLLSGGSLAERLVTSVTCPIQFVQGTRDNAVPFEQVQQLAKDIKDVGRAGQRVTFAEIEGPHNLMRKTPDEFCKAVIPFILGSGRPGPYTRT